MDYGKVLTRAWEITWRWKVLWILGFLASLGSGISSANSVYNQPEKNFSWQYQTYIPPRVWAIIAAVACLAVFIGIALWVISVIARGGLIAGVQQVEDEGATRFGQAWRVGAKRFWTLFGISILTALPILILVILGVATFVLLIIGSAGAFDQAAEAAGAVGIVASVFCGGLFCCGTIALAVVLGQIQIYAERAAILEGLGWIDAFKRGWDVIKNNLGPTIIVWLIFAAIGLIVGIVVAGVIAAVAAPFAILVSNVQPSGWIVIPIVFGGLLLIVVGGLVGAIVSTFTSTTWTLTYRRLTAPPEPEVEPVIG